MNVPANPKDFNVLVNEDLKTTSRIIAERFGKRHDNVQRDIRNIIAKNPDWGVHNFEETPYVEVSNGQTYQMYEMTRDGYTMLVMGFTGKAAIEWKIKFLEAFNAMEAATTNRRALPNFSDPAEAARAWADQVDAANTLQIENSALTPKAKEFDNYLSTEGVCRITDFCNKHQVKKNHPGYTLRRKMLMHQKKLLATQAGLQSGVLKNVVDQNQFEYVDSKGRSVEAQMAQVVVSQEHKLLGWIVDEFGMTAFRNKPAFEQAKMLIGGAA